MEKPKVSLVILNHNRKNDLRELLEELKRQSYPHFETIVVDNNSQDGSLEEIEKFPEIRLIKLPRNMGVEGYNIGMINARGKYIIRLDSDTLPAEPNLIDKIVSKFQANPNLAIVACRILDFKRKEEVWDNPAYSEEGSLELGYGALSFNGSGCAIRKDVLEGVGYFPAEFFVYYEELDFSLRVLDRGLDVKYFPDITVYHKGGSPINKNRFYYVTRNIVWLYWRHLPFWKALPRIGATISYSFLWSIKKGYFIVFFKALGDTLIGLPQANRKRRVVAPRTMELIENFTGLPGPLKAFKKLIRGAPL